MFQLDLLRRHGKGDWNYNNTRPVQPIHQRVVRTNINFKPKVRKYFIYIAPSALIFYVMKKKA
jgi:hypothetical protein